MITGLPVFNFWLNRSTVLESGIDRTLMIVEFFNYGTQIIMTGMSDMSLGLAVFKLRVKPPTAIVLDIDGTQRIMMAMSGYAISTAPDGVAAYNPGLQPGMYQLLRTGFSPEQPPGTISIDTF